MIERWQTVRRTAIVSVVGLLLIAGIALGVLANGEAVEQVKLERLFELFVLVIIFNVINFIVTVE